MLLGARAQGGAAASGRVACHRCGAMCSLPARGSAQAPNPPGLLPPVPRPVSGSRPAGRWRTWYVPALSDSAVNFLKVSHSQSPHSERETSNQLHRQASATRSMFSRASLIATQRHAVHKRLCVAASSLRHDLPSHGSGPRCSCDAFNQRSTGRPCACDSLCCRRR